MKKYENGLIVGKFSPLHKGHEFAIEYALERCETLYIFSYSNPEFDGCEAHKREFWLKTQFPQAQVFVITSAFLQSRFNFALPGNDESELAHRRFVGFLWLNLVNKPLNAVFTSESYGDGFAAELSRYFALYSDLPYATHIAIDIERKELSISGTQIRQDVHRLKNYLSPKVYSSFVKRICFLGGESSGKSTLAKVLADEFKTVFVSEYGRTLWEEQNGNLSFEDLLRIAKTHVRQEEILATQATQYLFIDTSPLTTLFYSLYLFKRADPELFWWAQRRYDYIFLCAADFPFVQDGTRADEKFRMIQHEWYLESLQQKQIKYTLLEGSLVQRIEQVKSTLEKTEELAL